MPTIREQQESHDATFIAFGETEIVETFGHYEAEYAAIRKGVGILHEPQRGLLQLKGKDVKDFLHRMNTQDMTGGQSRRAFQLNGKGRITADMIVHHGDACTWIEADACDLEALASFLDSRLFGEDVALESLVGQRVKITLHGPQSTDLLRAVGDESGSSADAAMNMPDTHHVATLAGDQATVWRRDDCGVPGAHIWVPTANADNLYLSLAEACGGLVPDVDQSEGAREGQGTRRPIVGRGIGWLAYNTARIEAGMPLYHVDFGPDSLPHETGVLDDAVSFTKGCYLGQEVVARMHNLGHPKRVLVGLKGEDDRLPVAGSQVFNSDEEKQGEVIGGISSSTLSPMRGNTAIAFATMKWGKHTEGTKVLAPADGEMVEMTVTALKF